MTFADYDWDYAVPDPTYQWTHSLLADVLQSQSHCLREMDIGWLGYTNDHNDFDVSSFPVLHTMAVCVSHDLPDARACDNWLTPSLETLILDFNIQDSHTGPISRLDETQAEQLIYFTELARQKKEDGHDAVGLKEIGLRLFNKGLGPFGGLEQWSCGHEMFDQKTQIVECLRGIEKQGFSSFWIGYSGVRWTADMMEEECSCPDKSTESLMHIVLQNQR